jgi:hypothetical protein
MSRHRFLIPLGAGAIAAAALPIAGGGVTAQPARATTAATSPTGVVDPVIRSMQQRYRIEVGGSVARRTLARLAHEPGLLAAVRSQSTSRLRAYVAGRFRPVWYHWHVSRLRITRGNTTLVETGVPFVVDGPTATLRAANGKPLARLQISIQDLIGYVRLDKRVNHLDTVVRGRGAADVRTSLPAALRVKLPSSGNVTIAGRRYHVGSFSETGWRGEPLRIWILR